MKAGKKLLCLILSAAMISGHLSTGVMAEETMIEVAEENQTELGNAVEMGVPQEAAMQMESVEEQMTYGEMENPQETEVEIWQDAEVWTEPEDPQVWTEPESEFVSEWESMFVSESQTENEVPEEIENTEQILFGDGEVQTERSGSFILSVDAGGKLVIAPEYVFYTEGQTVQEALLASGHIFTGMEEGMISVIDGVVGNYTRSDEDGNYALDQLAAEVQYFRFSEDVNSMPGSGLQSLMKAMAEYQQKDADVKNAAKEAYDMACQQFSGIADESARVLATKLNEAVSAYEQAVTGTVYAVSFYNGTELYSGVSITAANAYGKVWTDDGDGVLNLPAGTYTFTISQDGLRVEGTVEVSADMTISAALPTELWLKRESFRFSGSYGAPDNEENKFTDDEFTVGEWNHRQVSVMVPDTFTGSLYSYVEYEKELLATVPKLTAAFTKVETGEESGKNLPFESLTSGISGVLKRGAVGNTVIYSVCHTAEDGFTYVQEYQVTLERQPSLSSISVRDQRGVDQTAMTPFDGNVNEYTYKVLDTVTSVQLLAEPLDESYTILVNGEEAADGAVVEIDPTGDTTITVTVLANGYSNEYILTIQPGEGKALSFVTDNANVTVEVVTGNGMVMPFEKFREGTSGNRYQYILVPGETYSYVATCNTWYHLADEFTMEDAADSTIQVNVPMEDWLTELAFGTSKYVANKNDLLMDTAYTPEHHKYQLHYVDTEHLAYIWATSNEDVRIEMMYHQIFGSSLYHGKEYKKTLVSGGRDGEQLKRFLMDENPFSNTVTIRLTKEIDGVTYYQDYAVEFLRTLTLKDISAKADGITTTLIRGEKNGFDSDVKEYEIKVSMATKKVELEIARYQSNCCYGEAEVGYTVKVDGQEVTESNLAEILLDGTMQTQTVTVTVENAKAPEGSTEYQIHILKSPPVETKFEIQPETALLYIQEELSKERIWAGEDGVYQLCEGYSYPYTLTQYGYVGKSGVLSVTRDEENCLVIMDGEEIYAVEEGENGSGTVTLQWSLAEAERNNSIITDIQAEWENFRGNNENNAVSNAAIPMKAEEGTLYWANQIGSGIDSDAVGSPIIVDGYLITYASDKLYRVDTVTGEILATGIMDHKSSFCITPPTYADGMIFMALSDGTVQAFNATTLESLWLYKDPLGGQPNCPLTVKNGYLYTGFWNSETGKANFVCLSITDEDPYQAKERKSVSWYYTQVGGFYWAGAYVSDNFVLVGTDDGTSTCVSQTSSLLLLDVKTGALLDCWDGLDGDIRSSVVYDRATNAYYFTSKGGSFYSVQVENDKLVGKWSVKLSNDTTATPMSTCSPSVYNGRAYVGVSGAGQFSAYSGHNITVIDLYSRNIAYKVKTQGYPQTSGLLTTAYEEESGYVYIYFFDNMTPGKLRVLRDKAGQTSADYITAEGGRDTAYALFTPTGEQAQYAICSPIVDEYGTIYFKNDSAHLMAYGSTVEKIEVTANPDKMVYREGESFDPSGITVTAIYTNGKTRDITQYVTYSNNVLSASQPVVTISFDHVMYHNVENGTEMTSGVETLTPMTTITLTVLGETAEIAAGDVNLDGTVNLEDINLIVSYYYGRKKLEQTQKSAADVNADGVIDIRDANQILFRNEI